MDPEPSSTSQAQSSLAGVVGHQGVVQMLTRAMARDTLHHALLISGPAGVGKKTLALALIAARLCARAPGQGCGQCPSCVRVRAGNHSDSVRIGPSGAAQRITRASVQQAVLDLQRAPHEGHHHLTLIDPAERMGPEAANALLKTLEEPRPGVMIALITRHPAALLPTLRSRCLHLPLTPLTQPQTETVLGEQGCDVQTVQPLIQRYPGQPGQILASRQDPSLSAAQHCVQVMQRHLHAPGAIFGPSPVWSAWDDLVAQTPEPSPEGEPQAPAVERVSRSKKKAASTGAKTRAKKTTSSASKKPSAARQRQAIRSLCELWLAQLREEFTQVQDLATTRLQWHKARALMRLAQDCERNVAPRLLLERALLSMSPPPAA